MMPVKLWHRVGDSLTSSVETSRRDSIRGEYFRADAEALDEEIDRMLDRAVALSASVEVPEVEQQAFVQRWAIGRALKESGILQSEHLDPGDEKSLWTAIAHKCRLGVRADGSLERAWGKLVLHREADPKRIERDVFALGLWLQEQDLASAMMTFGAKFFNARRLHGREAISSCNLRDALARWLEAFDNSRRAELVRRENFEMLAKALAARFPARGPGSAKRPVHYSDEELYAEIRKVLDPLAEQLAPALPTPVA